VDTSDPELFGQYLIDLSKSFKSFISAESREQKIGTLLGFDLYIRARPSDKLDVFDTGQLTDFYAVNPASGIKYNYNGGHLNIDNPKLAARYFISAIDRVDHLIDKHQADSDKKRSDIEALLRLATKPFDKEEELKALKKEATTLEKSISDGLSANKLKAVPNDGPPDGAKIIPLEPTAALAPAADAVPLRVPATPRVMVNVIGRESGLGK
jgi:hypothetical protein